MREGEGEEEEEGEGEKTVFGVVVVFVGIVGSVIAFEIIIHFSSIFDSFSFPPPSVTLLLFPHLRCPKPKIVFVLGG